MRHGTHKYCMTYNLVDESRPFPSQALVLIFFSDYLSKLPVPSGVGDILRCHRLKLKTYRNEPQLTGSSDYASLLLVTRRREPATGLPVLAPASRDGDEKDMGDEEELGDEDDGPSPVSRSTACPHLPSALWSVKSSSEKFSFDAEAAAHVLDLHKWFEALIMSFVLSDVQLQNVNLHDLQKQRNSLAASPADIRDVGDMTVMVLGVSLLDQYITVWDGTTEGMFRSLEMTSLNAEAVQAIRASHYAAEMYNNMHHESLYNPAARRRVSDCPPAGDLPTVVLLGNAVRLQVNSEPSLDLMLEFRRVLRPGMWVRIRNVNFVKPSETCLAEEGHAFPDDVVGKLNAYSFIMAIQPFFKDVQLLLQNYLGRTRTEGPLALRKLEHASHKKTSNTRTVSASGAPYSFLATCMSRPAPAKYLVKASVSSWFPQDITKFVIPSGPADGTSSQSSKSFLFSLEICDEMKTASCCVIFTGDDARFALKGHTAKEFSSNADVREEVMERLQRLVANQGMLDFYIRSYETPSGETADSPPVKRFRAFNTSLF